LAAVIPLACLVVASSASTAQATYPGGNGRIAYQVEGEDGPTHLWWADPDLSDASQLTFGDHNEFDASWSADGTTLVFSTDVNSTDEPPLDGFRLDIATLNVLTGEHHVFETGAVVNEQPSFSPDGSRILFAGCFSACDPSTTIGPGLYTIRSTDGGDLRQVIGLPQGVDFLQWPRYSPDGSRITFAGVKEPSWRRQGGAPREGAVYVVNADGTGLRRLTPDGFLLNYTAEWSPDGSQLAMQTDWRPGTRPSLWIMNADGSNLHRLTDEIPVPAKQSTSFQASFAPTWAPDGSVIMFNCAPSELSFWDFCTIRPDGSARTLVRSTPEFEHRPTWQPIP
jgi:Tol biopolymer transport system component